MESEQYGDAVMTTFPERLIKKGPLPGHASIPGLEPRGALWLAVRIGDVELQVINTHLGLVPGEQRAQAKALVGDGWLGAPARRDPLVVVGDFNATPRAVAYGTLASVLMESRRVAPRVRAVPTFPSRLPVLAIDHVFVSAGVSVEGVSTPDDPLARRASDHLPLIVDFRLDPA